MVEAYNFLYSWQLFPEKGIYEKGNRPKSGFYKIEAYESNMHLKILMNWVTWENQSFSSEFIVPVDGTPHPFTDTAFADFVQIQFINSGHFEHRFTKKENLVLQVIHEIMPNGYLKITQKYFTEAVLSYTNVEYYHKQMSVLPYSSSVSGAVIKPDEEGIIRHKALSAMEEQTNMQLTQIRRQIELLALQAQEIQSRKELSMLIYDAKLSFTPVIGNQYYLYEKKDDSYIVTMISPKEWGGTGPYKKFIAAVKLLADHTWIEVTS